MMIIRFIIILYYTYIIRVYSLLSSTFQDIDVLRRSFTRAAAETPEASRGSVNWPKPSTF